MYPCEVNQVGAGHALYGSARNRKARGEDMHRCLIHSIHAHFDGLVILREAQVSRLLTKMYIRADMKRRFLKARVLRWF